MAKMIIIHTSPEEELIQNRVIKVKSTFNASTFSIAIRNGGIIKFERRTSKDKSQESTNHHYNSKHITIKNIKNDNDQDRYQHGNIQSKSP